MPGGKSQSSPAAMLSRPGTPWRASLKAPPPPWFTASSIVNVSAKPDSAAVSPKKALKDVLVVKPAAAAIGSLASSQSSVWFFQKPGVQPSPPPASCVQVADCSAVMSSSPQIAAGVATAVAIRVEGVPAGTLGG